MNDSKWGKGGNIVKFAFSIYHSCSIKEPGSFGARLEACITDRRSNHYSGQVIKVAMTNVVTGE